jgi:hypothetical protein
VGLLLQVVNTTATRGRRNHFQPPLVVEQDEPMRTCFERWLGLGNRPRIPMRGLARAHPPCAHHCHAFVLPCSLIYPSSHHHHSSPTAGCMHGRPSGRGFVRRRHACSVRPACGGVVPPVLLVPGLHAPQDLQMLADRATQTCEALRFGALLAVEADLIGGWTGAGGPGAGGRAPLLGWGRVAGARPSGLGWRETGRSGVSGIRVTGRKWRALGVMWLGEMYVQFPQGACSVL